MGQVFGHDLCEYHAVGGSKSRLNLLDLHDIGTTLAVDMTETFCLTHKVNRVGSKEGRGSPRVGSVLSCDHSLLFLQCVYPSRWPPYASKLLEQLN